MHCHVFDIHLGDQRDADQAALNAFLDQVDVVSTTATLVNSTTQFWSVLVFFNERPGAQHHAPARDNHSPSSKPERSRAERPKDIQPPADIELNDAQMRVYVKLREWRSTQAQTEGVPVYVVAHNKALQQIAQRLPQSREDLLQIDQFGAKRVEKYADAILAVLATY